MLSNKQLINKILSCVLFVELSMLILFGANIVNYKIKMSKEANSYEVCEDFYTFKRTYTKDYDQAVYGTNCGPTMYVDVLSYYEEKHNEKYLSRKDGEAKVPQFVYDDICKEVSYNPADGTYIYGLVNGLEEKFEEKGKKCKIEYITLNKWFALQNHIDKDEILLLAQDEHIFMIGGYAEYENKKFIEVFTLWREQPFQWIEYSEGMSIFSVTVK